MAKRKRDTPKRKPRKQTAAEVDQILDEPLQQRPLEASEQLRELAICYDDVADAQAKYELKADAAKTAKKTLEAATNALLEKVREFTHPTALPLFDAEERERDQQTMLDAADHGGAADVEA